MPNSKPIGVAYSDPTIVGGTLDDTPIGQTTPAAVSATIVSASDGVTIDNTSGLGIRLDVDAPVFGWRDITASVLVRGVGANDPDFVVYTGTTTRSFRFSSTIMNEVFFVYHIPHDYVPGTAISFHAHWSNAAVTPNTGNTGNVVWSFDYSFAKGFGQEAFPTVQTVTVVAASPATRHIHNTSETVPVTILGLEADGLILVRAYRDADNVLDTCTDAVFFHTGDVHYQSSNIATKNKAPNFYV